MSNLILKDALEYEFQTKKIVYERERRYEIKYKTIILPRRYNADFIVYDSIFLEAKASSIIATDL